MATDRKGSFGLTPPATGPLALIKPSDVSVGGGTSSNGTGGASQSSRLSSTLTIVVTDVQRGGLLRVAGEKRMRLGRGDELVRLTGLVRTAAIDGDNVVPSTRLANAAITVVGKGQVADAARAGWLQRLFDKVSPS